MNQISVFGVNATGCNPMEKLIINFNIRQLASMLPQYDATSGTCFGQQPTLASTGPPTATDVMYRNYTTCATGLVDDLLEAMRTPKYGFYDMCLAAKSYNSCISAQMMESAGIGEMLFAMALNKTHKDINEFLKDECSMISKYYRYLLN